MKLLAMLLLSGNLMFATSEVESVEVSEIPTEEVSEETTEEISNDVSQEVSDVVTEEIVEQTELQKLLEQWLNGEIELDDITLQKIYTKLGAVS